MLHRPTVCSLILALVAAGPSLGQDPYGSIADLKLAKTKDLASQLSNAEWLLSMPGPDDQKGFQVLPRRGISRRARFSASAHA